MANKTNYFEHESLQDQDAIINYLEALTDGIKKGEILFSDEDETMLLHPQAFGRLRIRASQTKKVQELRLRISWNNKEQEDSEPATLKIKAKKAKKSKA